MIYGLLVLLLIPDHLVAEPPDAGAGIHDNQFTAVGPDFNTGGIAPVFQVIRTGHRNGPA
jgi:hypothetical protein